MTRLELLIADVRAAAIRVDEASQARDAALMAVAVATPRVFDAEERFRQAKAALVDFASDPDEHDDDASARVDRHGQ